MMPRIGWFAVMAAMVLTLAGGVRSQEVLTLERALEIAAAKSPDIARSQLDLIRSRETLNAQKAALKSQFRLSLSPYSFSQDRTFNDFLSAWSTSSTASSQGIFTISQPIAATDGTLALTNRMSWQDSKSDYRGVRDRSFNNNLNLTFTQPIFTYNRTKLQMRGLELDLESTMLSYSLQKLTLERRITQAFYSAYQSTMSLDIARDELANQEKSFEIMRNKVEAGLIALEEQYQAELNLATSQLSFRNREISLANTLDSFKLLIGIPIDSEITISANVEYTPVEVDLDTAIKYGLKNRFEIRQNAIGLQNAYDSLVQTSATNEFKGNISLTYGLTGTDENFSDIYDVPTKNQRVGLTFDIPIWDWGQKEARINAARVNIDRQKLTATDEHNSIILEIRQTQRNLANLVGEIEIARTNVRNAQLTYDINLERYSNGNLTSFDLNQFQSQLSQRKIALNQALISYKLGLLDLKIQTLWDFEKDQSVLTPDLYE